MRCRQRNRCADRGNLRYPSLQLRMRFASVFLVTILGISSGYAQNIAVVDATVYASPEGAAQKHTTVLILNGNVNC